MRMYRTANGFYWAEHLTKNQIIGYLYNAYAQRNNLSNLTDADIEALKCGIDYTETELTEFCLVNTVRGVGLYIPIARKTSSKGATDVFYSPTSPVFTSDDWDKLDMASFESLTEAEKEALQIFLEQHI